MNKPLIIGVLSVAALSAGGYGYYRYAKNNLNIDYNGIDYSGISSGILLINFNFAITSKIKIGFIIKALSFNIFINGQFVGIGQLAGEVAVPGNGATLVTVSSQIDISKVEGTLLSVIQNTLRGTGLKVDVQGNCEVIASAPFLSFFTINIPIVESYKL